MNSLSQTQTDSFNSSAFFSPGSRTIFWKGKMPESAQYLSKEKEEELRNIANAIIAPGKGILAADESVGK